MKKNILGNLRKPSLRPKFKRALKRSRRLKFVSAGFRGLPLMMAVYATFLALGMPDGAFGVALPGMREAMGFSFERAAEIVIVHSIFYSVVASLTGRLAKYFKLERITGFGFMLLLAGMLGFAVSRNFFELTAATVVLGTGMGMMDSAVNAFAAKSFSAKHMNWLHCFWAMGGAVSPMIMRQMIIFYDWRAGYLAVFAVQAVFAFFVGMSILKGLWVSKEIKTTETASKKIFLSGKKFPIIQWFVFFLYTGAEYSVTFWTVSILMESRGVPYEAAAVFPAVYLGSLMAGRFIFGYVTDKISGSYVIRIGLATAVAGLLVLTFTSSIVGIALVGFGFAPVFPCLMDETKKRFDPKLLSKLVGLQIAAAGAGVALSAFSMGRILTLISLEALFPTVIICAAVAFALNEFIEINLRYHLRNIAEGDK